MSDTVGQQITADYPDDRKILDYLEEISKKERLKLSLFDVSGRRIFTSDWRQQTGLNLELKSFIVTSSQEIYVLEFVYPFALETLGHSDAFKSLRNFSIVLLALAIVFLILYLHGSMAKPLTMLHEDLEKVRYRHIPRAKQKYKPRKDEIGDLRRKYEAMLQRLETSYTQQIEMIASISHDLKTPLTSVLGYLERLQNSKSLSDEKRAEYLGIIHNKALDIKDLLEEFTEFAYSDLPDLQKNPVNMMNFFTTLAREYGEELATHGVVLNIVSSPPSEVTVLMDEAKIRRVIGNLVQNALKYADGLSQINMECQASPDEVIFSIEDDGIGVPLESLSIIFEKFYRLDKTRSREKGGCGLGLAICRNIIETHGGTINASVGSLGRGLKVTFSLPRHT